MKEYQVVSEIRYAARVYNAGEIVYMPDDRAEKYLKQKLIKQVEAPKTGKKEAN